ncbi:MAG: hypothetical protein DI551_03860 [Micavibrio aeruginosavorus]|uniref:Uncharacterized protein n=1 Tax=Micavibrio aeruginosavorus TaxID=349221 RepID=A0A2W5N182_9BACT|nr:MAG: hypothetical protein DI551_03860 [Micavibrio aeruginosavorus]
MKIANLQKSAVKGIVLLAVLTAPALIAGQAFAAGIDLKKIPALKEYTPMAEPEFEKLTKKIEEPSPYGESLLSYEIRLPKNWTDNVQQPPITEAQKKLSGNFLGIVGRYIGAPKNLVRSYVTVEAQEMTYEISAQNWFVNFILGNGFSLTAMTEKSPREIEAIYVQVDKDQTYVVRTRMMFNGSKLIMVRYYLPQENYEEEKALQAQIVSAFKLTKPVSERIEKQAVYGFLDQSYFNYPVSWTLKEKSILSIERMSALLYQESRDNRIRVLDGHIKINVISRLLNTTMAQEVETFRANLKIDKYKVGKLIENIGYDYDPSIKSGRAQVYELLPDDPVSMKTYELVVTIMQGDDYYYITNMITPSREQDFYNWAQNMEAMRIVNESMRRNNISLEVDPNDPYFDYLKEAQ